MEEQEQQYTKGFNQGYLLAQYEPELAKMLAIILTIKATISGGYWAENRNTNRK